MVAASKSEELEAKDNKIQTSKKEKRFRSLLELLAKPGDSVEDAVVVHAATKASVA